MSYIGVVTDNNSEVQSDFYKLACESPDCLEKLPVCSGLISRSTLKKASPYDQNLLLIKAESDLAVLPEVFGLDYVQGDFCSVVSSYIGPKGKFKSQFHGSGDFAAARNLSDTVKSLNPSARITNFCQENPDFTSTLLGRHWFSGTRSPRKNTKIEHGIEIPPLDVVVSVNTYCF